MEYVDVKPTIWNRLLGALADFLFTVVVAIALSFVSGAIVSNTPSIVENRQNYIASFEGLFITNDVNQIVCDFRIYDETTDKYSENVFDVNKTDVYDQKILDFYNTKCAGFEGLEAQIKTYTDAYSVEKYPAVFKLDGENVTFIKENEGEVKRFFEEHFDNAGMYLVRNDANVSNMRAKMTMTTYLQTFIPIGISIIIFYLIIPLCTKKHYTVGKKIFHLRLVSVKNDELFGVNFYHVIVRFLVMLITFVLSYFMYYIPVIISLLVMIFTKKNYALHDLVARTLVVDENKVNQYILEKKNGVK